jgi:hypothetical protein
VEYFSQLYVVLAQFSFKKLDGHLPFFLSSCNKNRDKAFAILSKENDVALERLFWSRGLATAKRPLTLASHVERLHLFGKAIL